MGDVVGKVYFAGSLESSSEVSPPRSPCLVDFSAKTAEKREWQGQTYKALKFIGTPYSPPLDFDFEIVILK